MALMTRWLPLIIKRISVISALSAKSAFLSPPVQINRPKTRYLPVGLAWVFLYCVSKV